MDVLLALLGVGIILFLSFLAELFFKKTHVPDVLLLLAIGIIIGPTVLGYVNPSDIAIFVPLFTTATLLFLLYEGGFNIDIHEFVKGALKSFNLTIFNFIISSLIIAAIMYLFKFTILQSLLAGFTLGGVSSAFVIPLVKELKLKSRTQSILTFESALTDVLCIVFAFAVLELILIQSINLENIAYSLFSLFFIASIIGIGAGLFWIFLVAEVFKEKTTFMSTIAYIIVIYVVAEMMNANGAIAALLLGMTLKNSEPITRRILEIKHAGKWEIKKIEGIIIVKAHEGLFYQQVSFFLKTFFFVYIGIMFNVKNLNVLLIAGIISLVLLFSRRASGLITKEFDNYDRAITMSMFARGLAAAAIAQIIVSRIPELTILSEITYAVIIITIVLSSLMIFKEKMKYSNA